MNFNKAIVAGNLTRDPETRTMPSGQNVVNFSVASNRVWTDQSGNRQSAAEFHNIVAFGKLADICSRYLSKGRLVMVEGRIQTRSWQGQDGNKRSRTEIVAENMQMGPRSGSSGESGSFNDNETTPANNNANLKEEEIPVIEAEEAPAVNQQPSIEQPADKEEINVKDIPF